MVAALGLNPQYGKKQTKNESHPPDWLDGTDWGAVNAASLFQDQTQLWRLRQAPDPRLPRDILGES